MIRLWIGFALLLVASIVSFTWSHPFDSTLGWVCSGVFAALGVVALVEARLGWCAARAAGFRVPF